MPGRLPRTPRGGPPARLIAANTRGAEGVDVVTWLEDARAYRIHVGSGVGTAAAARGERELTIPEELLERISWLVAAALAFDDGRRCGEVPT